MKSESAAVEWLDNPGHRRWLAAEGDRLLGFFQWAALNPHGGFSWLDGQGRSVDTEPRLLWLNARVVHAFSLAHIGGRPGAAAMVEHGLTALRGQFQDHEFGGWYWAVDDSGPVDTTKQAYAHAFVLLAASSAVLAGFDQAEPLLADAIAVIDERFWDEETGLCVDTWDRAFTQLDPYRGQNANMHMTEAFAAASAATGDDRYLHRAAGIAERLIRRITAANDWRLPEHFDTEWRPELEHNHDDPENQFRAYGSTIGHWLEWARLLVQLRYGPAGDDWMLDAAKRLFDHAVTEGWDSARGGLRFTVDWQGKPLNEDRYHWVIAEAIGAAAVLERAVPGAGYERWYQRFWDFAARYHVDVVGGSWHHQLDRDNVPKATVWAGKPDLYHAYQATLVATAALGVDFAGAVLHASRPAATA